MSESKSWDLRWVEEAFAPYRELEEGATPQARKKMRILRAASELFETQGYRKTSVDEIARKAGVGKGSVYLHYASKARILVDAIGIQKMARWQALKPLFTGEIAPEDRFRHYVHVLLRSGKEVPLAARLMQGDGELAAAMEEVGADPEYQESMHRGEEWIAELIEQAAPGRFTEEEKQKRVAGMFSLGMLMLNLVDPRVQMGHSYDELVSTLTDMIVYGTIHHPPENKP